MEYYDVFISCNSKDYAIAEELYNYLEDNGFKVFLASRELRNLGDSDYIDAITKAIDSTYHLIVLGSSIENFSSKWVEYEWKLFLGEQKAGRKNGNLMKFVYGNLPIEGLHISLREIESFTETDYKDRIIGFVKTPAYLKRKDDEKKKEIDNNSIGSALKNVSNLSSEDQLKAIRMITETSLTIEKYSNNQLTSEIFVKLTDIAVGIFRQTKV